MIATVELEDAYGRKTRKKVELEATTIADARDDMEAWVTAFRAISDLGIASITYSVRDAVAGEDPVGNCNLDTGATFALRLSDGSIAPMKIPGIKISLIGSSGWVDTNDQAVVTFFNQYTSAGDCLISDGEKVANIISGQLDR